MLSALSISMIPFTVPLPSTALMGLAMLGIAAAFIRSPAHKRRARRGRIGATANHE